MVTADIGKHRPVRNERRRRREPRIELHVRSSFPKGIPKHKKGV